MLIYSASNRQQTHHQHFSAHLSIFILHYTNVLIIIIIIIILMYAAFLSPRQCTATTHTWWVGRYVCVCVCVCVSLAKTAQNATNILTSFTARLRS